MKKLIALSFLVAIIGEYPTYQTLYEFVCKQFYGDVCTHRLIMETIYESCDGEEIKYLTTETIERMNEIYLDGRLK